MIAIKLLLIISIIISITIAFFSFMLLYCLLDNNENFIFTKILPNKAKNNFFMKAGAGVLCGSSIFLILTTSLFLHNYNCRTLDFCESDENSKINLYHQNKGFYGKSIEWINVFLIILLLSGLTLFSIEFFKLLEDDGMNKRDEMILWIIFSLTLFNILLLSCLFIHLLIVKKPKEKPEGEIRFPATEGTNEKINPKCIKIKKFINEKLKKYENLPEIDNKYFKYFLDIRDIFMKNANTEFLEICENEPRLIFNISKYLFANIYYKDEGFSLYNNTYQNQLENELNKINKVINQNFS